ncbi:hypothetical protein, partial [Jeotgalibaca porci]|uniref:hypothetical protein n=1 Tax=Jeotgalibaca porci TaxID=1868793 RepID=UPI00359F4DDF
ISRMAEQYAGNTTGVSTATQFGSLLIVDEYSAGRWFVETSNHIYVEELDAEHMELGQLF